MKELKIIINPLQEINQISQEKNDELILSFRYFQNYLEFSKQYSQFKNYPLYITLEHVEDLDFSYLPANDIYFNLSNLPFKELKFLLVFLKNKSNCFFLTKYDTYKYASKEELINSLKILDEMAKYFIGMSPSEICFCLYDLIRTRKYIKYEDNNCYEDNGYSRDICQILNHKYMVCLGFANLYACLLEILNIKSEIIYWVKTLNDVRHVSNLVYLNDEKYNIHGLYIFDLTYDRITDLKKPVTTYRWCFNPIYYDLTIRSQALCYPTYLGSLTEIMENVKEFKNKEFLLYQLNQIRKEIGLDQLANNIKPMELKAKLNELLLGPYLNIKQWTKLIEYCRHYEQNFNHDLFALQEADLEQIIESNLVYQKFILSKRKS